MRITIKMFKRVSDTLRKKLMPLTLETGTLLSILECKDEKCVLVAYGPKNKIYGWCCIYSVSDLSGMRIGVFVNYPYRHKGLGTTLRKRGIEFCLKNKHKPWWWHKDQKCWIH